MYLWKFTRGYVKIRMNCTRPERMVNILLAEGVSVHNIERTGLHEIGAVVKLKDYQLLCSIANAHGCDVSMIEQRGLPVYLRMARSRPLLALVLLAGLIALPLLAGRIWVIDVTGCDKVDESAIVALLRENGVGIGTNTSAVNRTDLARRVLDSDDYISFADIRLNGVVLTVSVHEVNELMPAGQDVAPSSIYSDKDCIILSIIAEHGRAAVRTGQAVKRGELLISGDITPQDSEESILVHAVGTIVGQVAYRFAFSVEPTSMGMIRSGEGVAYLSVQSLGIAIHSDLPFDDYETETNSVRVFDACGIPVTVQSGIAYELVSAPIQLSEQAMMDIAISGIDGLIGTAIPKDARIIMKTTDLVWNDDGTLTAIVNIQTIENIGYSRYM